MILRGQLTGGHRLLDQDVDDIAIFRMQRHQTAVFLAGEHGTEKGAIVHHQAIAVGHVHLDGGDAILND